MPLPPCDKILQIILPAYLQLQSPYYFQKVVWSLSLDYFIPCSTLYVPCVTSSFIQIIPPPSSFSGMEYGNVFEKISGWCFMPQNNHFIKFSLQDILFRCPWLLLFFFFFLSENRDTPWVMDNIYCGAADANHTCWIFHIQVVVIYLGTGKKSCQYCPLMYPSWGWWYIRGIFYSSVVPYIKGTNSLCPVEH